jgi:hypothetical protein
MKKLVNGVEVEMTRAEIEARQVDEYEATRPRTNAEIAASKEAADTATMTRLDVGAVERVLLKIAFLQENRIRDLEGSAAITLAQFKTWVKAQL